MTEGKKVQMRITTQKEWIIVEIFSFNGATEDLIKRKFEQFAKSTQDFIDDKMVGIDLSIFNPNLGEDQKKYYALQIEAHMRSFSSDKYMKETTNSLLGITQLHADILKSLIGKLPSEIGININNGNYHSFNENQNSNIAVGDNNTQNYNDLEYQLDLVLDQIFEIKQGVQSIKPSENTLLERLETQILSIKQDLKKGNLDKLKEWIDKVEIPTKIFALGSFAHQIITSPQSQTIFETIKNILKL
jgi:hypothetical protein